jgi:preprotein translocase subunit YajC
MQQLMQFLPLILIFVAFYFFLIRPQQKQQKKRQAMLASLKKGDKVVTIGGLHGSVVDLTEEKVTLKVSDNTRLVFERSAVNAVLNREVEENEVKKANKEEKQVEETKAEEKKSEEKKEAKAE